MPKSAWMWVWWLASCGAAPNDRCRLEPERCQGGPGGFCSSHEDCATELCCELDICDGGMCTFACEQDLDCPSPMRCREEHCFYDCTSTSDCADGQECEEGTCLHEEHKPGKGRD